MTAISHSSGNEPCTHPTPFCLQNSRRKEPKISLSHQAVLVALFISGSASATEYYWSNAFTSDFRFPSPAAYCAWSVGKAGSPWWFVFLEPTVTGQLVAQCRRPPYENELGVTYVDLNYPIYRVGDSCQTGTQYDPTIGQCLDPNKSNCPPDPSAPASVQIACPLPDDKGPPKENSCVGNPIDIASGNKFQLETDYISTSTPALAFQRSYNSTDGLWRHNFSSSLRLTSDSVVTVALHHGRELVFTLSGSNFVPRNPDQGLLEKKGNGWEYLSADNERLVFDNDGRLLRQTTTALGTRYLAYTANGINVDDEAGNRLTFSEDGKHQPTSLRTPDGQVTYSYDSRRLTAVTRSNGEGSLTRRYHYEDSRNGSLLTGITDERGVRYASWHYDNQGRAISSEHATGAEKISLSHHGGYSTRVTNEYGKQAIYYFQVVNGSRRIVAIEGEPSPNCPSSNSTFTYDERGLLTSKRDNNGNLTTYQYSARGLETSRTEAAGTAQARTITTDWHPTLFLPVQVSE
ncbi:DUF6531 domain-containing protein, partial [Pseudomonas aeruginosa]